jgi:uncharacterized protein YdiU (UPF0061 family)
LFYVLGYKKAKGDPMAKREAILETGWNLDSSYARLPESFFTILNPTAVRSPKLIILNYPLATSLGLNVQALQSNDGVAVLAGNRIPEGALPSCSSVRGASIRAFYLLRGRPGFTAWRADYSSW